MDETQLTIDLVRYQYKRQQQEYTFTREHFFLNAKFAAALCKNDRIHYQSMYQLQKLVTSISIVKIISSHRRRLTWNGVSMLNISHHLLVYM